VIALACAALVVVAGCHRQEASSRINIEAHFDPDPPRLGRENVTLLLNDRSGHPLRGASVRVEGNMAHPGMAPVFGDAKEIEPGRYEASLDLGMMGTWAVLLHVRLADGEKIERQMDIEVKAD
jgi:hypothetical protein